MIINGGNTKVPQDFKRFLSDDENKKQPICLLLKEWINDCYAMRTGNRNIYFVCEEECFKLEADGNHVKSTKIGNLGSCQKETDTKIVLHMKYAVENHHSLAILVRSPYSDIFFIILYYAAEVNATIIFDTGHGNQRHLLDLSAFSTAYGQEYCEALLPLHAFSHCDTTSAFVHIGKVKPIKTLEKFPCFQQSLRELDQNWELDECTMVDLDILYEHCMGMPDTMMLTNCATTCSWTNASWRVSMQVKGQILVFFHPCREALKMHIKHVNYHVRLWKLSHIQNPYSSPLEHGWIIINNKLEPQWVDGNILLTSLTDILDEDDVLIDQSDEEDFEGENMQGIFFNDDDD